MALLFSENCNSQLSRKLPGPRAGRAYRITLALRPVLDSKGFCCVKQVTKSKTTTADVGAFPATQRLFTSRIFSSHFTSFLCKIVPNGKESATAQWPPYLGLGITAFIAQLALALQLSSVDSLVFPPCHLIQHSILKEKQSFLFTHILSSESSPVSKCL